MEAGSVVISKSGRDKGRRFIVLRAEGDYVFLADGELRKVDKPKKKKIKHIQKTNSVSEAVREKTAGGAQVENFEIRRALSEFEPDD
jgi:ribosomal protein L14E/L6E/L27E